MTTAQRSGGEAIVARNASRRPNCAAALMKGRNRTSLTCASTCPRQAFLAHAGQKTCEDAMIRRRDGIRFPIGHQDIEFLCGQRLDDAKAHGIRVVKQFIEILEHGRCLLLQGLIHHARLRRLGGESCGPPGHESRSVRGCSVGRPPPGTGGSPTMS